MKFTDRQVRNLKPQEERYEVWEAKGLGLRVSSTGRKTWIFMYRYEGKARRLSLGTYPAMTVAMAHEAHGKALAALDRGIDPGAVEVKERREARQAPTITELLDEFWRRELQNKKSGAEMRRLLEKDVIPAWGHRKARDITRRDVVLLLDAVRERAPITANRLHGRLTRLFNFAAERGIIEQSPCTRIRKPDEQPRERVLTDDEIYAFWHGLDDTGIDPRTALALKLILVTGQRPGEVSGMTWGEVEDDWWTIPADRAKNGQAHRVPLSPLALNLLEQAQGLAADSDFVFPSPRPNGKDKPLEVRTLSRAVDRKYMALGIPKFVPHDLRRSVRTRLAELGINDVVAERVLNHTLQGIARVYNRHNYDAEKRAALEAWEGRLLALLNEQTNVVPIRHRQSA